MKRSEKITTLKRSGEITDHEKVHDQVRRNYATG